MVHAMGDVPGSVARGRRSRRRLRLGYTLPAHGTLT